MTFAFNFDKSGIHMNCMDNHYDASHMLLFSKYIKCHNYQIKQTIQLTLLNTITFTNYLYYKLIAPTDKQLIHK